MNGWMERSEGEGEKLTRNIKCSCFIFKGRGEGVLELIHEGWTGLSRNQSFPERQSSVSKNMKSWKTSCACVCVSMNNTTFSLAGSWSLRGREEMEQNWQSWASSQRSHELSCGVRALPLDSEHNWGAGSNSDMIRKRKLGRVRVVKENSLGKGGRLPVSHWLREEGSAIIQTIWVTVDTSPFPSIQRNFFLTLHCGCRWAKILSFFTMILIKILTSTSAGNKYSYTL